MKPILFSQEFIPKIQSGEKTVTRRLVKPQPVGGIRNSVFVPSGLEDRHGREIKLPYRPGDILWVRETWKPCDCGASDCRGVIFPDHLGKHWIKGAWRPSIHMPRWAARIFLEVTDVRIERVQEITGPEVFAEGIGSKSLMQSAMRFKFKLAWEARYPGTWDANAWVWVIKFRRSERA